MSNYKFSIQPLNVPKVDTNYRKIKSAIPAPDTNLILEKLNKNESRSMHGQLPIVWDKAKNYSVYDQIGNCWIDFTSTIFVANVGHSNQKIVNSIKQTLDDPLISSYAYANKLRSKYLESLIKFSGYNFEK